MDHNKIFVHFSFIMRQLHGRYAHLYLLRYCSSYQNENFGTDFFPQELQLQMFYAQIATFDAKHRCFVTFRKGRE